jgi:hypothetical protein
MPNRQTRRTKALKDIIWDGFKEFAGSVIIVLSIYGVRKLVEYLLGQELLWDILPIRYCQDTVDFAVFVRFAWRILRSLNED